jgi:3-methyladenine DNA glycosylase/8-oxoguanine DNA glycosylase
MMELLAKHFGPRVEIGDTRYWAFPSAEEVRKASLAELRECKVGYRANRILKASEWFSAISQPSRLSVSELQELDGESALQRVCEIPGIGPYSAAIVLSAGAGRQDIFHLDSFTRYILHQFYFDGREVTDTELRDFVETKWSGIGGSVAHVLTTNTETWAKNLGHEVSRRSAARQ